MRIALTGGIACGKSCVASFMNSHGVETLDADDIVHELIPADERRRLAAEVFRDPAARQALERRIHPLVRERIDGWLAAAGDRLRVAVIPLLFEVHWDEKYDIILCVTSEKATQVARMMTRRGYSREEAEARLAAQLPVAEKAARSHYAIANDGSLSELSARVAEMVAWLEKEVRKQ